MSLTEPNFTSAPVETVRLLPIYILCDTSQSMAHDDAIGKINEGLAGILREINKQGARGDDIRLCVISFATKASVAMELTSVEMDTTVPQLTAGGVTNLQDAVTLLSETLSKDYHALRNAGERAYRPAAFVFTDGRPTDQSGYALTDPQPWLAPLEALKTHPIWAPRIFAYGFGDAQPDQLRLLVSDRGVSDSAVAGRVKFTGGEVADSLGRLFPHLFKTITDAAAAAADGASEEQIAKALDDAHSGTDLDTIDPRDWWSSK